MPTHHTNMPHNNTKDTLIHFIMLLIVVTAAVVYYHSTTNVIRLDSPAELNDRLVIDDHVLIAIKYIFDTNVITGNETSLLLYGSNDKVINISSYHKPYYINPNSINVSFSYDKTTLMILHNHPNNKCNLSTGDINTALTIDKIVAVYCYDSIRFYIPQTNEYGIYNITINLTKGGNTNDK